MTTGIIVLSSTKETQLQQASKVDRGGTMLLTIRIPFLVVMLLFVLVLAVMALKRKRKLKEIKSE